METHLVILLHSKNGQDTDFDPLIAKLSFGNLVTFAPDTNNNQTMDGIANCAQRLYTTVRERLNSVKPKYLSIIGHGIGG